MEFERAIEPPALLVGVDREVVGESDAVAPADEVVEEKGVRVLIDPKALLFLLGTEMDYKTEKLSAQFVFNNPNQTSACGCGESVELKPAVEAQ